MLLTGDPERDFDAWDRERERRLIIFPKCCCCEERILDDDLYDFDGDLVCFECVDNYIDENFKKNANRYILEEI
jgi:hypothetical protein